MDEFNTDVGALGFVKYYKIQPPKNKQARPVMAFTRPGQACTSFAGKLRLFPRVYQVSISFVCDIPIYTSAHFPSWENLSFSLDL